MNLIKKKTLNPYKKSENLNTFLPYSTAGDVLTAFVLRVPSLFFNVILSPYLRLKAMASVAAFALSTIAQAAEEIFQCRRSDLMVYQQCATTWVFSLSRLTVIDIRSVKSVKTVAAAAAASVDDGTATR